MNDFWSSYGETLPARAMHVSMDNVVKDSQGRDLIWIDMSGNGNHMFTPLWNQLSDEEKAKYQDQLK